MEKLVKYQIIILLLFLCSFFSSCSKKEEENEPIVAKVGKEEISYSDFQRDFMLNPQYIVSAPMRIAKNGQLKSLIENKYYYLSAQKTDLAEDSLVRKRLDYIYKKESIRFYLQEKFLSKIKLTPTELKDAYQKMSKRIRIQQLYAPDEKSAQKILGRLKSGDSFEQIAKEIYKNNQLKDTGGDIGFVTYGDLDQNVEEAIYSIKINQISDPVKSDYGYHIIRVLEIEQNEMFLRLNPGMKENMISDILKNRKATSMIREHLEKLTRGHKIQINNHIVDFLYNAAEKVLNQKYNQGNLLQPPIMNRELNQIVWSVKDIKGEIVAIFNDEKMTVEDLLIRLQEMPPYHRPTLDTRKRLIQSIIDIIRNDIFYEQAKEEGINRKPEFKDVISKLNEELLSKEFRNRLLSTQFKEKYPKKWDQFNRIMGNVKSENNVVVYEDVLFKGIDNPDSVMAPTPIPVFLKSAYDW